VIELSNVTKVYPMGTTQVRALDGVSLRVDAGEFVAIVGASGSGKSTLMHVLGCLDRPTGGSYRLLGQTVSALDDRQLAAVRNRSVGFVFQTFNLIPRMTAWENVAVPLFYARQTSVKPRALTALERVGLTERATHQPNELSGGERQRVAIARAIVNGPRLILADEPTGNLDSQTGEQIMDIFHELHRSGVTVVLVTHEPDIAEQAQRIVSMRDGRIVSDKPGSRRLAPGVLPARPASQTRSPGPRREPPSRPTALGSVSEKPLPSRAREEAVFPSRARQGAATADAPEPLPHGRGSDQDVPSRTRAAPTTGIPTAAAVVHPNARRAVIWTAVGPASMVGLVGWVQLLKWLGKVNPGFVQTVGRVFYLLLLAMIFVAPVFGIIHGRRGARWVRLAPAQFRGLGRARVAQWIAGVYLVLVTGVAGLILLLVLFAAKTGWRPG